jgi:hypothetical protein
LVQVLDKGVNTPFKGYLGDQFEEWMCTNGSRRRPSRAEVAQWVANAWEQVTTATIVNTWKSIGHKVADDNNDDDDENIVANRPGAGQGSTMMKLMKLKTSLFIKWQMRGKIQLLSSNTTLTMTKMTRMTNPSSWT